MTDPTPGPARPADVPPDARSVGTRPAATRRALLGALLAAPAAGPLASTSTSTPASAAPAAAARPPDPAIRFSAGTPGGPLPRGWQRIPLNERKTPTDWSLEADDGVTVLAAHARASVSLVMRAASIDPRRTPVVAWRWKIDAHPAEADNAQASKEDSAARLVFVFDGDRSTLPLADRAVMRVAKSLSGRDMPYATLMYVVSGVAAVDAVVPNPHTRRVQMVVASGAAQVTGRWVEVSRDLAADFRRAFGEAPGRVLAYGVMSDTDNTGAEARAWYGDIAFRPRPGRAGA